MTIIVIRVMMILKMILMMKPHDDPYDGHDVATEHQTGFLSHCPALRVSDGFPGTQSQMQSAEFKILHFHRFRKYQIGLLTAKDYILIVFV